MADTFLEQEEARLLGSLCFPKGAHVLNAGAGNPDRAESIWVNESVDKWEHMDLYPKAESVKLGDVRRMDYPTASFDVVVLTRVLSNVPVHDRHRAIKELHRVLKPHGQFIFADGMGFERSMIDKVRELRGWDPLPPTASGNVPVTTLEIVELRERFSLTSLNYVAPDYTIFTRVEQKELLPFGDLRAMLYPRYAREAHRRFGMYQVVTFKKCEPRRSQPLGSKALERTVSAE